jgi:hypothetical protein
MNASSSPKLLLNHLVDEILNTGILTRTQELQLSDLACKKELTEWEGQALGRFLNAFMRGEVHCV